MLRYTMLISSPALAGLAQFSRHELREIRRLLGIIQLDPSIDGRNKIVVPRPPAIFNAYVSLQFWILYRVVGDVIHV